MMTGPNWWHADNGMAPQLKALLGMKVTNAFVRPPHICLHFDTGVFLMIQVKQTPVADILDIIILQGTDPIPESVEAGPNVVPIPHVPGCIFTGVDQNLFQFGELELLLEPGGVSVRARIPAAASELIN